MKRHGPTGTDRRQRIGMTGWLGTTAAATALVLGVSSNAHAIPSSSARPSTSSSASLSTQLSAALAALAARPASAPVAQAPAAAEPPAKELVYYNFGRVTEGEALNETPKSDGYPRGRLRNGAETVLGAPSLGGGVDKSVRLDGVDDLVETDLVVATNQSFTVTAWASLTAVGRSSVVLSQDGSRVSGFQLKVDPNGRWAFSLPTADSENAASDTVLGPAAVAQKWTRLAGVYDAAAGQLRFYVNGIQVGARAHTASWSATGGMRIGRGLSAGSPADHLGGSVTEVRAYQGALTDSEITDLTVPARVVRADRCKVGDWLHVGGPQVKAAASAALAGSDYDRRMSLQQYGMWPPAQLESARKADEDATRAYLKAPGPYPGVDLDSYPTGAGQLTFDQRPDYGQPIHDFLLQRADPAYAAMFRDRALPKPTQAALDKAFPIAAQMRKDALPSVGNIPALVKFVVPTDEEINSWSAFRLERFLRYGGLLKVAPAKDSAEYRMDVESIKVMWAACDTDDPYGTRKRSNGEPDVLFELVNTARAEWNAELAAQAKPRADIVAAEIQAMMDVRAAAAAMIESQEQAWVAGQLLKWQKFWQSRPRTDSGYPTPAVLARSNQDLDTARARVAEQLTAAQKAAASAKTQADKATTAQAQAAAIAKANGTPIYRGLAYAQQSAQVAKASAAAAQAAAKAVEATLSAVKANNATSQALQSLALTQQAALQAEFRRMAAQEAAAQARAAALAGQEQANQAAAAATRAKNARERAEKAELTAKNAADDARKKRIIAEQERDKTTAARKRAEDERAKAGAAEEQARRDQAAAATARGGAEASADTAVLKADAAEEAEYEAGQARDAAVEAERQRDATAARLRSLEALAAAAAGTEDAKDARAAANAAKTAADQADTAARSARGAADRATKAAVAARAAATQAAASAKRSRAASDGAEAAFAITYAQAAIAHAAAAEAIDAAHQAADNVKAAEEEARKAAGAAVTADAEAKAAKIEADKATAESAVTAGFAYAAAEAATAARDAATAATAPANEAIALGTPFQAADSSAGMAVLVGQSAKTVAEQQAAAAEVKAVEAAKAAQAAREAAARANGDAKAAADAAASAAADAAKAAESVKQARLSAAAAAKDAEAAQRADANAARYLQQAQTDAITAKLAAQTAKGEADRAESAATEAEKDAAGARNSATIAEDDAHHARGAATRADGAADAAEESASNANGYAEEAQQAAQRAEEQRRKDELAERAKLMEGNGGGGALPTLGSAEEKILFQQCGQSCVDEYRAALAAAGLDVLDWVKQNSGQILLDLIGYTDAKRCFTEGSVEGCLWTVVNAVSIVLLVGKIPAVSAAIVRIGSGIGAFFRASKSARITLDRLNRIIENGKKTPGTKPGGTKPGPKPPAKPHPSVSFPHKKHPKLGSDGKYYLKEGDDNVKIVDPANMGHEITDIDRVRDGILWEEKTAVSPKLTPDKMPDWVEKQVNKKIRAYIEARRFVKGYEDAPIGLRFTENGVVPGLRGPVEKEIAKLRAEFPNIDIFLEWP